MSPKRARLEGTPRVVALVTLRCPSGHHWTLPARAIVRGRYRPTCWAPACEHAPLTEVGTSTIVQDPAA